ncbi:MAG: thioesterase superfamily protein [Candidatus Angelobacter sp.]|jgi:acyl-CoA thioester hydrolase|nr:thioesterase superfamily protein [Candidatus Angelobacter sp.]
MSSLHPIVGQARVRVRYAETDKMGVVYHSNFIVWFEVGRVELLRQLGFSYRDMELQDDCHIAVVDVRCRYKSPAYYDDELVIRTRLKNLRGSLMVFDYQVQRLSDETLLAEGETTHLVVNAKMEKTMLPEKYVKAFAAAVAGDGNHPNSTTGKSNG